MLKIPIENFNQGGLSDSELRGIKYSIPVIIGLDLHSKPGIVQALQKLTKSSGSIVDALVKVAVSCSDGNTYAFSSTTGKVWKITSAFAWSLVHTTTPAAGGAGCLGAYEYKAFLYWFTESRVHRIAISDLGDWSTNAVEDWATFSITDASYHPAIDSNGDLYIGDGYYVAIIDSQGTFTANALDLFQPHRIKCLGKRKNNLLIGTYIADNVNLGSVFEWNTYSPSWSDADSVKERGINAFIPFDNDIVVSTGINGRFYYWDGSLLKPFKTIPGTYNPSNYLEVHPGAVGNFRGIPIFGISKGAGDPTKLGVYALGKKNSSYPDILTLDFPISQRSSGNFVLANIEIGSIVVTGNDILVFWVDTNSGTVYGADKLDWANKLDGAYFESRYVQPDRDQLTVFKKFLMNYKSLPANTAITMSYDKNYAGSYTALDQITDTQRLQVRADQSIDAASLQWKVALTTSSNDTPEMEEGAIFIQDYA